MPAGREGGAASRQKDAASMQRAHGKHTASAHRAGCASRARRQESSAIPHPSSNFPLWVYTHHTAPTRLLSLLSCLSVSLCALSGRYDMRRCCRTCYMLDYFAVKILFYDFLPFITSDTRALSLRVGGVRPMPITRPDWPANGLFFAFSRPLAEGWPGSAGRWPKILSTLHCSITSLVTKLSRYERRRKKKWT